MKITVYSTSKVVELNGVPCRIWEGETSNGVRMHCFIARVGIDINETRVQEFENDLQETRPPSPGVQVFPLRMVL